VLADVVDAGVPRVLVTGIARDGMMTGPDIDLLGRTGELAPDLAVIASGGVGSLDDLRRLKTSGASGVITGKALLDGVFTVEQALLYLEVSPWEAPVE